MNTWLRLEFGSIVWPMWCTKYCRSAIWGVLFCVCIEMNLIAQTNILTTQIYFFFFSNKLINKIHYNTFTIFFKFWIYIYITYDARTCVRWRLKETTIVWFLVEFIHIYCFIHIFVRFNKLTYWNLQEYFRVSFFRFLFLYHSGKIS